MKRQLSLKWFITLSFLSITIILVVAYSLLNARFYMLGMDNILANNMAEVVKSYVKIVPAAKHERLAHFSGYWIADDWQQMPAKVRLTFKEPENDKVLIKNDDPWSLGPPEEIIFLMRVLQNNQDYFVSQSITRETASALVGRNAAQNMRFLLVISLASVLALVTLIFLFLRRVEQPVKALGHWAHALNENNLLETPPDFSYPELNQLASLIRTSLSSVQDSLEREHSFLRHSSHELRTPISVIRNNVELFNKLQKQEDTDTHARKAQIIDRIDRASLTMKHLTETLLWLSRESEEKLPEQELDLEELIRDLVAESHYLLKEKEVETEIQVSPYRVRVSEAAARIVLGNLIRNSFQHIWCGSVHIVQKEGMVEVINDMAEGDESNQDLGFGLGLRLTEQLAGKLNWAYRSKVEQNKHSASIDFG